MIQKNILTSNGGQQVLNESKVDSIVAIALFSAKDFLTWWYIQMSLWHLKMLNRVSTFVDDNLSISILLKNFFVPWHRDNNMIGWVFGIILKILYLPIAIVTYFLFCIIYILLIFIWLLLPPATILFILSSFLTL